MQTTKQSIERSGSLNPMWGKKQSLETKKKISDSQKRRYQAIRKAVIEQSMLQLAATDGEVRNEFIHQLLDKNNVSFDNVQPSVNFIAFLLEKDRVKSIIKKEIDKLL